MIHLDWGSIIVSVPSHAMSSISLSVPFYFPSVAAGHVKKHNSSSVLQGNF
jgi:hypothetical protein